MSEGPKVDVLVPVFNGERYLSQAIGSILEQSHRHLAVIVVDDGSTDGTASILAGLAARDGRMRVVTRPNGGIVEALNLGLSHCTAELVARHDADDIAYPERLAQQVGLLMARPDVVAVGGSGRHINGDGQPLGTIVRFPDPAGSAPDALPALEPYLLHPCLMFRRASVQAVGGYRHVVHAEDSDLYWRLQEQGVLCNDTRLQCDYRMHDASISGGSLVNGRVMAVSSQLAALSAMRRRRQAVDLSFTEEAALTLKNAASTSLAAACSVGLLGLNEDEAEHLRIAASLKLLDLAGYRPFELATCDCEFIGGVLERALPQATRHVRGRILRSWSGSAARLSTKGMRAEAIALLRPPVVPAFYARVAARTLTPSRLYKLLGDLRHGRLG